MRRLIIGSIVSLLLFALGGPFPSAAQAQSEPSVSMRLVSQTVWTGKHRPLEFVFTATNDTTAALEGLSVELVIMLPARSRSLYELSIHGDPTPVLIGYPFSEDGRLDAGATRTFRIKQPMELLEARNESALYPLRVELRSNDVVVGTLRSPMIFLIEHPEIPLNLAWTWVLSTPIQYGPDGVFGPGPLENDIAPGGRLEAKVDALLRARSTQVDLVVSAALVDQLVRMSNGYRIQDIGGGVRTVAKGTGRSADAARLLASITSIAGRPGTELVGSPLGDPSLPALSRAGLITDLSTLDERGDQVIREALERPPQGFVIRPPASQLDSRTLPVLVSMGAGTLLVDTNFIPTEKFATPTTVQITAGKASATAILPEPQVPALAAASPADPRLAAHIALGELAAMWFELPGTPGRGAAVMFSEAEAFSAEFLHRFSLLVRGSPWLDPIVASSYVRQIPPVTRRPIGGHRYPTFDPLFVSTLVRAKGAVSQFRDTVPGAQPVIDRLRSKLLLAESGAFVTDPRAGTAFVESVDRSIDDTYERIRIASDEPITLTSQSGFIPLTLVNGSGYDVRVMLKFVSDRRLQFSGGATRVIELRGPNRTLLIGVRALTTGRIPIKVQLLTSGDRFAPQTITQSDLIIRSTAYNRVALIITIGAALFLMIWWGRRFLPRRR